MAWEQIGSVWKGKQDTRKRNLFLKCPKDYKTGKFDKKAIESLIEGLEKLLDDPENGSLMLTLDRPKDKFERMASSGKITEDEAEEKIGNLPNGLVFEVKLPPQDD